MTTIITSKTTVKAIVVDLLSAYQSDADSFIAATNTKLLSKKIRFPLLEFAAKKMVAEINVKDIIPITDKIIGLEKTGSYVLAGIILQSHLNTHFTRSVNKAVEYIIRGDKWYVCDIIGERVFGFGLLHYSEKMIPVLEKHLKHENKWIVRSVGVAAHYAIKKGLEKNHVETIFKLLLTASGTTDFHTKKGIGWAAKTTAKFHPDIIAKYNLRIENNPEIRPWFKTKIRIGLGRSAKYATRNTGKKYTQ